MGKKVFQTFKQKHTFNGEEEYTVSEESEVITEEYGAEAINNASNLYKSFYEASSGNYRELIDSYAKERLRQDLNLATMVSSNPLYQFGQVNRKCDKFGFTRLENVEESSMCTGIEELFNTFNFSEANAGSIIDKDTNRNITRPVDIIKFGKALVVGQISPNIEFSKIVSAFTRKYVDACINGFYYPIDVECNTDLERSIIDSLNKSYLEVLTTASVEYATVIGEGKKKTPKKKKKAGFERVEGEVVEGSALRKLGHSSEEVIDV